MFPHRPQYSALSALTAHGAMRIALTAVICLQSVAPAVAAPPDKLTYRVSERGQQLEMVVNSSRIVEMDFKVPRMLVENPAVLSANPISPTQIQLAGRKPGVTHITMWDANGKVHSLDVIVIPDARELEYLLKSQFPEASLKVRPLASSVAISGYCPSAPMVSRIITIAEDYYPRVINNIEIGGAQQVLLHVKVLEVSRTKLRTLGVDWGVFSSNINFISQPAGLVTGGGAAGLAAAGQTLSYGVVSGSTRFFGFLEALRRNNLLKVLSEPTLTTVSGRAASFNVGGEFPILVPQSLGTVSIEYRQFGTRVDFVPIVRSNGEIRLEVRPQVSEIDASRSVTVQNATIPGLRSRWVDTAAEMRAGQTLALAGLLQTRVESETRSVPVLGDLPGIGAAFRRVEESNNEVELLILVTPELVEPMDKHETPKCGPGQFTKSPSDAELYDRGWLEVPKCCENCGRADCRGNCRGHQGAHHGHQGAAGDPRNGQPVISHGAPAPQPAGVQNVPAPQAGAPQADAPQVSSQPPLGAPPQYPYGSGAAAPEPVILPAATTPGTDPQTSVAPQTPMAPSTSVPSLNPGELPSDNSVRAASYGSLPPARTQSPGLIGPSGYDLIR